MSRPSTHADVGSRDHCRYCGRVIEYQRQEEVRRRGTWVHLEPWDLYRPILCEPDDQDRPRRIAAPKRWCVEFVSGSWYSTTCHRPVKDTDLFMCGIHARSVRDRQRKDQQYEEKVQLQRYMLEEVGKIIEVLTEDYDLPASMEYRMGYGHSEGGYTGKICVDPHLLLDLLRDIANEEEI